jgi:hypothetical protein
MNNNFKMNPPPPDAAQALEEKLRALHDEGSECDYWDISVCITGQNGSHRTPVVPYSCSLMRRLRAAAALGAAQAADRIAALEAIVSLYEQRAINEDTIEQANADRNYALGAAQGRAEAFEEAAHLAESHDVSRWGRGPAHAIRDAIRARAAKEGGDE